MPCLQTMDDDTLGTYNATAPHYLHGSSGAAFSDEVVCHVQATSFSPPHYLKSVPILVLEQSHYA